MISSQHLSAHLAHVQAEQAEIEAVAADMIALTLTDNGPNHTGQPSKLWTSREEFQQNVNQNHRLPDRSTTLPIADILEGVSRLSLSQAALSSSTSAPIPASPLAQGASHQTRWERNRHTTKILEVFDQMNLEITAGGAKLTGTPTLEVLREVESMLNLLHPAIDQVERKTPSIEARKRQILGQLASLETRVVEWRYILGLKEPISYNTGEDMVSTLQIQ
jgi:hypothetical protein